MSTDFLKSGKCYCPVPAWPETPEGKGQGGKSAKIISASQRARGVALWRNRSRRRLAAPRQHSRPGRAPLASWLRTADRAEMGGRARVARRGDGQGPRASLCFNRGETGPARCCKPPGRLRQAGKGASWEASSTSVMKVPSVAAVRCLESDVKGRDFAGSPRDGLHLLDQNQPPKTKGTALPKPPRSFEALC